MDLSKKFKKAITITLALAALSTGLYYGTKKAINNYDPYKGLQPAQRILLLQTDQKITKTKDELKLLKKNKELFEQEIDLENAIGGALKSAQEYFNKKEIENCLQELKKARNLLNDLKNSGSPNRDKQKNINILEQQLNEINLQVSEGLR